MAFESCLGGYKPRGETVWCMVIFSCFGLFSGFSSICTGKAFVQLVSLHIVLQSSFSCSDHEMIFCFALQHFLFICPVSWSIEFEFAPVNGRNCCTVWCGSHLAYELPSSSHHDNRKTVSTGSAASSALKIARLKVFPMAQPHVQVNL